MRKVFLDVGGFEGESSFAALDPLFGFDVVYCFEPVPSCCERIRRAIDNGRFHLVSAGLFDRTATLPVYAVGSLGASVYDDSPQAQGQLDTTDCQFVRATEFFREHIELSDRVWMKLNCEGAEVAILNDLLDSSEARKLHEVLVDFDAAKIPRMHGKVDDLEVRLTEAPFNFHYPSEVQFGMVTNFGGIRNWLLASGAADSGVAVRVASALYQIPYVLNARFNGYYKIRLLRWLKLRPPPNHVPRQLRSTLSRID